MNVKTLNSITHKQAKKAFKNKSVDPAKVLNFSRRLLGVYLKRCFKPILVIYLTDATQKHIRHSGHVFLKTIERNVNGKFYILVLPAYDNTQVRAELWCKGKMLTKHEKQLFENNIWVFNEMHGLNQQTFEIQETESGKLTFKPYNGPNLDNVKGMMFDGGEV